MRLKLLAAALLFNFPASAADLFTLVEPTPPPPPPAAVYYDPQSCTLGTPIITWRAPNDERSGQLPAGLTVEVIEPAWSPTRDLWVRLRAPRPDVYYGWVSTASLVCRH